MTKEKHLSWLSCNKRWIFIFTLSENLIKNSGLTTKKSLLEYQTLKKWYLFPMKVMM